MVRSKSRSLAEFYEKEADIQYTGTTHASPPLLALLLEEKSILELKKVGIS